MKRLKTRFVPATIYEGILFGFALFKTFERTISSLREDRSLSLYTLLLRDNILYFFGCVTYSSKNSPSSFKLHDAELQHCWYSTT